MVGRTCDYKTDLSPFTWVENPNPPNLRRPEILARAENPQCKVNSVLQRDDWKGGLSSKSS